MLLFKKKFLPAIRAGQKTQTIRLWKHRRMRAGQRSYIPGVGHIRVTGVDEVELDQLTDADALPDGFETADQLRAEIARLYPHQLADGYRAYRIVFRLATPDSAEEPHKYLGRRRGGGECSESGQSILAQPSFHRCQTSGFLVPALGDDGQVVKVLHELPILPG